MDGWMRNLLEALKIENVRASITLIYRPQTSLHDDDKDNMRRVEGKEGEPQWWQ